MPGGRRLAAHPLLGHGAADAHLHGGAGRGAGAQVLQAGRELAGSSGDCAAPGRAGRSRRLPAPRPPGHARPSSATCRASAATPGRRPRPSSCPPTTATWTRWSSWAWAAPPSPATCCGRWRRWRAPSPSSSTATTTCPCWWTSSTLVIASSYSGDTEETLSAFQAGAGGAAKKLVITTGGRLLAAGARQRHPRLRLRLQVHSRGPPWATA